MTANILSAHTFMSGKMSEYRKVPSLVFELNIRGHFIRDSYGAWADLIGSLERVCHSDIHNEANSKSERLFPSFVLDSHIGTSHD
jgi:hypothetical protein